MVFKEKREVKMYSIKFAILISFIMFGILFLMNWILTGTPQWDVYSVLVISYLITLPLPYYFMSNRSFDPMSLLKLLLTMFLNYIPSLILSLVLIIVFL